MANLTRRAFLRLAGLAGAASMWPFGESRAVRPGPHRWQPGGSRAARPAPADRRESRYGFFTPDDAVFIEAAVERLIPADEHGPGALRVGVAFFIDRQLAGEWGAGEHLHRMDSWQARIPAQRQQFHGRPVPRSPAELFRKALRGIEADLALHPPTAGMQLAALQAQLRALSIATSLPAPVNHPSGAPVPVAGQSPRQAMSARRQFAQLPAAVQDAYLRSLQDDDKDLNGVPSQVFYETLLSLTIEGFFSDPAYGGNEEVVAQVPGGQGTVRMMRLQVAASDRRRDQPG